MSMLFLFYPSILFVIAQVYDNQKMPCSKRIAAGRFYRYKKIYFRINSAAKMYIKGLIFFAFPVHTFRIT